MDIDSRPQLTVLSTHHGSHKLDIDKTVICSPHELIAVVTQANDVVVYRLNGQVAITIKHPEADPYDDTSSDVGVSCLGWSPSGRALAVAWSDGTWNVHEAEKGDIILKGTVANEDTTHVTGFDWQYHDSSRDVSQDDADLPRAITMLDVTRVLPKLSALPSHGLRTGMDGATFSDQAATDGMFSSMSSPETGRVEILAIYASDGSIRIVMDGMSHVGTVKSRATTGKPHILSLTDQSALACFSQGVDISCSILHLPLAELNSATLHVLAHCTAQLMLLSQYLQRASQCIAHDYTTGIAYPNRLVKSISMSLEDRAESHASLTSALVHLAMTGQFHPDLQEWLADIVKDTGLKRWDASLSGMYGAIQTHLHQHMLPALARISIAASRMRGFARFHQGDAAFAPEEVLFTTILRASDTLRAKVQAMLDTCISEWALWRAFARWLKMQIEIAAATPGTKTAAEAEERECVNIDFSKTMQYTVDVLGPGSALQASIAPQNEILLSTMVQALSDSVQTATQAVTNWQGRLFSKPDSIRLPLSASVNIRDARYASSEAMLLLSSSNSLEAKVISVKLSSTECEETMNTTLNGVIDALFYDQGVLMLQQSEQASMEMTYFNLAMQATTVLHRLAPSDASRVLVGGRSGKEFCIVFNRSGTGWQILDLHAAADAA